MGAILCNIRKKQKSNGCDFWQKKAFFVDDVPKFHFGRNFISLRRKFFFANFFWEASEQCPVLFPQPCMRVGPFLCRDFMHSLKFSSTWKKRILGPRRSEAENFKASKKNLAAAPGLGLLTWVTYGYVVYKKREKPRTAPPPPPGAVWRGEGEGS